MTNEEKATYIANANQCFDRSGYSSFCECKDSTIEMAKWKDQQFKEYLERKKKKLNEGVKNFLEKGEADTALLYQTQIVLLNEIINELFKED